MKKVTDYIPGIVSLCLPELIVSYGLQLGVFVFASSRSTSMALAMILAGPAAVVLINLIFGILCEKKEWYEKTEVTAMVCIGAVIYGLLMFLVFPHILIAYEMIPSGEMALGYGQLVIQLADCSGAGVCLIIGGIRLLYQRRDE